MRSTCWLLACFVSVGVAGGTAWAKEKPGPAPAEHPSDPPGPNAPKGPFDARKTERYHQRARAYYLVKTGRLRKQVIDGAAALRRAAAEGHEALAPFPRRARRVAGGLALSAQSQADLEKLAAALETEVLARLNELRKSLRGPVPAPKDSACAGARRALGQSERAHAATVLGDAAFDAIAALAQTVETEMPRIEGELAKAEEKRKLRSLSRALQAALGQANKRLEPKLQSAEGPPGKGHKGGGKEKPGAESAGGHDETRPFPMLRAAERGAGAVIRLEAFHQSQADAYREGGDPEPLLALMSEARVSADSAARLLREAFSGRLSEAAVAGKEAAQASLKLCEAQAAFTTLGLVKKPGKGKPKSDPGAQ